MRDLFVPVLSADFCCIFGAKKVVRKLEKTASQVIKLIRRGIKFTRMQPDVKQIEKFMLEELQSEETI